MPNIDGEQRRRIESGTSAVRNFGEALSTGAQQGLAVTNAVDAVGAFNDYVNRVNGGSNNFWANRLWINTVRQSMIAAKKVGNGLVSFANAVGPSYGSGSKELIVYGGKRKRANTSGSPRATKKLKKVAKKKKRFSRMSFTPDLRWVSRGRTITRGRPRNSPGRNYAGGSTPVPASVSPMPRGMFSRSLSPPRRRYRSSSMSPRRRSMSPMRGVRLFRYRRLKVRKGYFKKKRGYRAKRQKVNPYIKYGTSKKFEIGGVCEDSKAVYIGHATPYLELHYAIWRAVTKKLFARTGIDIQDWESSLHPLSTSAENTYYAVTLYLRQSDVQEAQSVEMLTEATGTTVSFPRYGRINTYAEFANKLAEAHKAVMEYFTDAKNIHFKEITLNSFHYQNDGPGGIATARNAFKVARMDLSACKIYLKFQSQLKVQNRTRSQEASPVDTTTDIDAQPLYGKYYTVKGRNGFELRYRSDPAEAYPNRFCGNGNNGILYGRGSTATYDAEMIKPPATYMFVGKVKSSKVYLNPSQVTLGKLYWKQTVKFDTIYNNHKIYQEVLDSPGNNPVSRLIQNGAAAMFGLEKLIDARNAANLIIVAYEVSWQLDCFIKDRRNTFTNPLVVDSSTAYNNLVPAS